MWAGGVAMVSGLPGHQPLHRRCDRHAFATGVLTRYLREAGDDIWTVPELLGHTDVRTTMISTHALNRGGRGGG